LNDRWLAYGCARETMDPVMTKDGRSIALPPHAVELPARPLSPWLRLAHVWRTGAAASGKGVERTIRDFMLMLQIEGDSWIWAEEAGGAVPMPRGSIAFVPPGYVHAWGECRGAHIAVHFDLVAQPRLRPPAMLRPRGRMVAPRPAAAMPWFRVARRGEADGLLLPLVTPLGAPDRWIHRLQPLIRQWGARALDATGARLRAAAILAEAMADLAAEAAALRAPPAPLVDARIAALVARLGDDDRRSWSVPALARAAGVGETALRAGFRALTGSAPRAYLERRRLERAAHRLVDSRRRIGDIAAEAGYDDPYHFSRAFRRVFGVAPRGFRLRAHGR